MSPVRGGIFPAQSALPAALLSLALAVTATPACADELPLPDAAGQSGNQAVKPSPGLLRYFDASVIPFIPVPEIATDPNSGVTVGILPVWITTNADGHIDRIIAPDFFHNANFGWGTHGRVFNYLSTDEQFSVEGGIKEKVERNVDVEYSLGRLRNTHWSIDASLIYDRSGTPRFYGIGNKSPNYFETNYTANQGLAQAQLGFNFNHTWQLLYTARFQALDVLPGTLDKVLSIQNRFPTLGGIGLNDLLLNRFSLIYDTRDDITVPSAGSQVVAYGGAASRRGIFNNSLYTEAGGDARSFWSVGDGFVLAAHAALHYLPSTDHVPFWALSNLGGGESIVGGRQALRGYGEGRFYDRNSFSADIEARRTVFSFDAVSTHVDVEMAPFIDLGRVFGRTSTVPFENLHKVFGIGFRGIARPFVVGKVDLGYGTEGLAIFTGLNYPF